MDNVLADFDRRAREVDAYFDFLRSATSPRAALIGDGLPSPGSSVSAEAQGVLKASTFLLLYNVVESSVRQALEAVYEEIQQGGYSYADASEAIRDLWISRRYGAFTGPVDGTVYERAARQIVGDVVDRRPLDIKLVGARLGGNIDADLIRQIADEHGIRLSRTSDLRGGLDLATVKMHRNNLAHGKFSFVEVGRDQSWSTLESTKEMVMAFTRRMLLDVETYLASKQYLEKPPRRVQRKKAASRSRKAARKKATTEKFRRGGRK